jgi:hypothetical protein
MHLKYKTDSNKLYFQKVQDIRFWKITIVVEMQIINRFLIIIDDQNTTS